jgi:hypothetical protein
VDERRDVLRRRLRAVVGDRVAEVPQRVVRVEGRQERPDLLDLATTRGGGADVLLQMVIDASHGPGAARYRSPG